MAAASVVVAVAPDPTETEPTETDFKSELNVRFSAGDILPAWLKS